MKLSVFDKGATLAEKRAVKIILALALLAITLPYLWALLIAPPNFDYSGLLYNPDDQNVHLMWARQASEGHLFFRDLFTTENFGAQPLFTNFFALLLGAISAVTRLPLIFVYHALRVLAAAALLIGFYKLCALLTRDASTRVVALALVAFGGGAGWLQDIFPARTFIDRADGALMMPEAFTFTSLLVFSLYAVSLALLIFIYLNTLRARRSGEIRFALWAALCAFLLANVHTYDAIPLNVAMLCWALLSFFTRAKTASTRDEKSTAANAEIDIDKSQRNLKNDARSAKDAAENGAFQNDNPPSNVSAEVENAVAEIATSQKKSASTRAANFAKSRAANADFEDAPDVPVKNFRRETSRAALRVLAPLLVVAGTLPSLLYQLYVFRSSREFQLKAVTPTLPPPLLDLALSYGILFPLALCALFFAWKNAALRRVGALPALWAGITIIAIYLPGAIFPFARRMIEGLHLPLCLLAACGLMEVTRRLKISVSMQRVLAAFAVALTAISSLQFLAWTLSNAQSNNLWNAVPGDVSQFREAALVPPLYISPGDFAALNFLNANQENRDRAVLTLPQLGNYVPQKTGRTVYVGHWAETLNFWDEKTRTGKLAQAQRFYGGKMSAEEARNFLHDNNIGFVILGFYEKRRGSSLPLALPLEKNFGDTQLYRVPKTIVY